MKRASLAFLLASVVAAAGAGELSAAVSVGDKAPPVKPARWLNSKAKARVSWKNLEGRLILVEKWATWCPPCRRSIPHLNQLAEKYGKRGLTIIGVTSESVEKVKPFIERMGMKYLVAIGGAEQYTTRGIPHAWLVDARGKCVWKGHPASLEEATVEKHLKGVRIGPPYALPRTLSTAGNYLNKKMYAKGIEALEKYLEDAARARQVLDDVLALGRSRLKEARRDIKSGRYDEALPLLESVRKDFKGHDLAAKAEERLSALKKDSALKREVEAAAIVNKAKALMKAGKNRSAAALLKRVTGSRKYSETRMLVRARKFREVARKRREVDRKRARQSRR